MAFTEPAAADLKARFAEFAAIADATVDIALADAALQVDDSWNSQEDFTLGRLLYAAHVLTLDGNAPSGSTSGLAGYTTIRSGQLTLQRGGSADAAPAGSIGATTYGVRFTDLQNRNRSGPLVADPDAY